MATQARILSFLSTLTSAQLKARAISVVIIPQKMLDIRFCLVDISRGFNKGGFMPASESTTWYLFNVYGQWYIGTKEKGDDYYSNVRQVLSGWEQVVDRSGAVQGVRSFFSIVSVPPFAGPVTMKAEGMPCIELGTDSALPDSVRSALEYCKKTEEEMRARQSRLSLIEPV